MTSSGEEAVMTTVLVVEDDAPLRTTLRVGLRALDLDVLDVASGEAAIETLKTTTPDLLLLDLNLPGVDGFSVLAWTREHTDVPVVVLTVREDRADKVRALDAGADDYVTKPFDTEELHARVRAALRRGARGDRGARFSAHGVDVDLRAMSLTVDGVPVRLTRGEWTILTLLLREPGGLVTHAQLLEALGRPADSDAGSLRVLLNRLRHKLGDMGTRPVFIVNEVGLGYRWLPESDT